MVGNLVVDWDNTYLSRWHAMQMVGGFEREGERENLVSTTAVCFGVELCKRSRFVYSTPYTERVNGWYMIFQRAAPPDTCQDLPHHCCGRSWKLCISADLTLISLETCKTSCGDTFTSF